MFTWIRAIMWMELLAEWLPLLCALGVYWLAWVRWRWTTNLLRKVAEQRCLGCGYPMRPSWPCPECGEKVGTSSL